MKARRIKVSRDNPIVIERFSNELRETVKKVADRLKNFFRDSVDGVLGKHHREIVIKLFNEWCHRNDIPSLIDLHTFLRENMKKIKDTAGNERRRLIDNLINEISEGLRLSEEQTHSIIVKYVAEAESRQDIEPVSWNCTKELLKSYINLFLDQTAHVIIGRILVYRVMEDKGHVKQRPLSLQEDPLNAILNIRKSYETLLPNIYALREFDWWFVPDTIRGLMDYNQKRVLRRHEDILRYVIGDVIKVLSSYDLSYVDFDLWQEVYQHYLPEEERQRLGGFYTPRELVALIIDLAGYEISMENLCKMKVLDPASGSGTFIVEATRRLIEHLNSQHKCHTLPRTTWEKAKLILETVKNNIYAIDIHPFASFLTALNLTMLLLDYYLKVHHQDPEYRLELNILTADSLIKSVQLSLEDFVNARIKEAHKRLELYKKLINVQFDYVFGNPPWGSVLKGRLSPLWNPIKRSQYKKLYKSAHGKYDVYVLFLERGIEWLKEEGILGMVVNNRFMTRDFGKAIREYLVVNTTIMHLVDLSEYGPELFPGATNYPIVIVCRKKKESEQTRIIIVRRKQGIKATDAIRSIYRVLQGERVDNIKILHVPQTWFTSTVKQGWFIESLELGIEKFIVKLEKVEGYKANDLLEDIQGVTTGLNDVFVLDDQKLREIDERYKLTKEPLIYKCIAGEDVKPWKISYNKWIIFPYREVNGTWELAFMIKVEGKDTVDALNFNQVLCSKERIDEDLEARFSKRVTYGLIPLKLINTAKYLVDHYEVLRSRVYEGKRIEEYAKSWYAYHRPRNPKLMKIPNIVTARVVKEPSFALNTVKALPLDNAIALVPKDNETKQLINELSTVLRREVTKEETLLYILAFLNSSVSFMILKARATRVRGGYFTIDEKFLSKLIIPKPTKLDEHDVNEIIMKSKALSKEFETKIHEDLDNLIIKIYASQIHTDPAQILQVVRSLKI